jgi:hypothetical protein
MNDSERSDTRLRMTYYDSSDGPRLMIFGPAYAAFARLQAIFFDLSRRPGAAVAVHDLEFVAPFHGVTLHAICNSTELTSGSQSQGIRRVAGESTPSFVWRRNPSGWDYLGHLIDSLVRGSNSGHQYLTSYPSEDAIVVISKGEYDDSVLQR